MTDAPSPPAGTDDASAPDDDAPRRRWGPTRVVLTVIVIALVSMWGYVVYLAFGPGRQPPIDRLDDPAFAEGFGDLTMHNVEGDPDDPNVAYIAWYSLGMRVVELNTGADIEPPEDETGAADWEAATPAVDDYYGNNVTEVGRWIAPDGSNFWGVTVTEIGGEEYILASDRNSGLHIFQMDESYCEIFVEDGVCP